jgi:peptide/nickel transport system ATP-binding protein
MQAMAPNNLVEVRGLSRRFDLSPSWLARKLSGQPRQFVQAVDNIDFSIRRGSTFALVGESGCGKSTVARLLVGLQRPSQGRVLFDGVDVHAALASRTAARPLRRRMQMIFQDPYASLNPRWAVHDIVAEPLIEQGFIGAAGDAAERVAELLLSVGLTPADRARYAHQFSGGQRQRISIARALASAPELLVCDEPTSALDVSVQAQVLNLMKALQRDRGLSYLFISHNLAVVRFVSDEVGVMYAGRIVEWADKRTLFDSPRHPYTRMLLDAVPKLRPRLDPPQTAGGDVPDGVAPPGGCSFYPRCPHANTRCRAERPALLELVGVRVACHAVQEGRL